VPSLGNLRERVRGWLHREPKEDVPLSILIVDGNATHRQSTARIVESLGYRALQTASIGQALEQLQDVDPEYVLLAFDLEDSTGLDALKQLRELDADLPVIMLAPDLWDSRTVDAMRLGALAYVPRPFGRDDLRELFGRP
jgi:DNA-binding NtrC family response regulator